MFLSTGNHLGLQEDTHYCPNATCWCVNCQLICLQKVHLWNVPTLLHIYEESIQIDMSTFPNSVDVSTVSSSVCRWWAFGLLPVWLEDTHYCPNATCWCVNCQLICMHVRKHTVFWQYNRFLPTFRPQIHHSSSMHSTHHQKGISGNSLTFDKNLARIFSRFGHKNTQKCPFVMIDSLGTRGTSPH